MEFSIRLQGPVGWWFMSKPIIKLTLLQSSIEHDNDNCPKLYNKRDNEKTLSIEEDQGWYYQRKSLFVVAIIAQYCLDYHTFRRKRERERERERERSMVIYKYYNAGSAERREEPTYDRSFSIIYFSQWVARAD